MSTNHNITLTEAAAMTANYRNSIQQGDTLAFAFDKDAVLEVLNQTDCEKLRCYLGLDDANGLQLILCGVLANGNDMYLGKLMERSIKCPQNCPSANPLNSNV